MFTDFNQFSNFFQLGVRCLTNGEYQQTYTNVKFVAQTKNSTKKGTKKGKNPFIG